MISPFFALVDVDRSNDKSETYNQCKESGYMKKRHRKEFVKGPQTVRESRAYEGKQVKQSASERSEGNDQ